MSSHSALERYEYSPLLDERSTRVVVLEPAATRAQPLRCHLVQINLDTFDKRTYSYEALSYVWGEAEGTQEVVCEGKSLLVTDNCEHALRALRLENRPRILWVDAICIDQMGDRPGSKEKSHQIRLMGHIYYVAAKVIVWLGECDEVLARTLGVLSTASKCSRNSQVRSHQRSTELLFYSKRKEFAQKIESLQSKSQATPAPCAKLKPADQPESLTSLRPLFNPPWACRIWTVQEIAFARACYVCFDDGSHVLMLPWSEYYSIIDDPSLEIAGSLYHWECTRNALCAKHHLRNELQKTLAGGKTAEARVIMMALLPLIADFKASDRKDKAYAMYPIFQLLGMRLQDPDYSKSVNVVYEEFTRSILELSGMLTCLQRASRVKTPWNEGLPSWVLDWSRDRNIMFDLYAGDDMLYGRSFPLSFPRSGQLELFGTLMGPIHGTSTFGHHLLEDEERLHSNCMNLMLSGTSYFKYRTYVRKTATLREWAQRFGLNTSASKNFRQYEAFFKLLTLLDENDRYEAANFRSLMSLLGPLDECEWDLAHASSIVQSPMLKHVLKNYSSTEDLHSTLISAITLHDIIQLAHSIGPSAKAQAVAKLYSSVASKTRRRIFFHTEDGHCGTCFFTARASDLLVLFNGTKEPYVLRPSGGNYRVISTAFIPNLIDLKAPFETDITKMQKFTLV